jgi:hypothetical protein
MLNIQPASARSVVHQLRKRFRELFREEVSSTVADPASVDDEMLTGERPQQNIVPPSKRVQVDVRLEKSFSTHSRKRLNCVLLQQRSFERRSSRW